MERAQYSGKTNAVPDCSHLDVYCVSVTQASKILDTGPDSG